MPARNMVFASNGLWGDRLIDLQAHARVSSKVSIPPPQIIFAHGTTSAWAEFAETLAAQVQLATGGYVGWLLVVIVRRAVPLKLGRGVRAGSLFESRYTSEDRSARARSWRPRVVGEQSRERRREDLSGYLLRAEYGCFDWVPVPPPPEIWI
jgi:hypothetical protein